MATRRVFFSFHYQDVIDFRANVVRQHWVTKEREEAGYFDKSLWESSKRTGDEGLKRLINDGLDGSSVTCVLIGSHTYARRWVRYEIFKSVFRGNGLFAVHINGITGKDRLVKPNGANPFDNLGVRYSSDGMSVELFEWNGTAWAPYDDMRGWSFSDPRPVAERGQFYRLSRWYRSYDWVTNDGYNNFPTWVEAAA